MVPSDKLTAAGAAGALVLVLAWGLQLVGIDMPPAVQTSLGVFLVWLAGYIKTERGALAALLARRKRGRHAGN